MLPGLTDAPRGMAAVLDAAREAGATHAWSNVLNLRPGTREHFLGVLEREWPEELDRYRRSTRPAAQATWHPSRPIESSGGSPPCAAARASAIGAESF